MFLLGQAGPRYRSGSREGSSPGGLGRSVWSQGVSLVRGRAPIPEGLINYNELCFTEEITKNCFTILAIMIFPGFVTFFGRKREKATEV